VIAERVSWPYSIRTLSGRVAREAVGSVADQLRRLLQRRAGIAAGVGSGRTGRCLQDWLAEQSEKFRNVIKIMVIYPSAPYLRDPQRSAGCQDRSGQVPLVALANQWSPRFDNASPTTCSVAAARSPAPV
jgi:hypothetical protein